MPLGRKRNSKGKKIVAELLFPEALHGNVFACIIDCPATTCVECPVPMTCLFFLFFKKGKYANKRLVWIFFSIREIYIYLGNSVVNYRSTKWWRLKFRNHHVFSMNLNGNVGENDSIGRAIEKHKNNWGWFSRMVDSDYINKKYLRTFICSVQRYLNTIFTITHWSIFLGFLFIELPY